MRARFCIRIPMEDAALLPRPPNSTAQQNADDGAPAAQSGMSRAKITKIALAAGATGVALAIAAPLAVPLIVGALGFGAGGIVAGSTAASIMASYGGAVTAGSACAIMQSIGAVGLSTAATVAVAGGGAAVGAAAGAAVAAAAADGADADAEGASQSNTTGVVDLASVALPPLTGEETSLIAATADDYCKICMQTRSNVALVECGHLLCEQCAPPVGSSCPFCRQPVARTLRIFRP